MNKAKKKQLGLATAIIVLMLLSFITGVLLTRILLKSYNTVPATLIDIDATAQVSAAQPQAEAQPRTEVQPQTVAQLQTEAQPQTKAWQKNEKVNQIAGADVASSPLTQKAGTEIFEAYHSEDNGDKTVWSKRTKASIFKTKYDSEKEEFSVISAYGDNVIAPGTKNSYDFFVNNTGSNGIVYTVETTAVLECVIEGVARKLPLEVRYSNDRGQYFVGSENRYVPIASFKDITFEDELSPNCYAKYTFDWQWPFEIDDTLDTMLGNLSAEGDAVVVEIEIKITATESEDASGGIPNTGDNSNIGIWMGIFVCSFVTLIMILFVFKKDKEEYEEA